MKIRKGIWREFEGNSKREREFWIEGNSKGNLKEFEGNSKENLKGIGRDSKGIQKVSRTEFEKELFEKVFHKEFQKWNLKGNF